jgi:hypothetical protein
MAFDPEGFVLQGLAGLLGGLLGASLCAWLTGLGVGEQRSSYGTRSIIVPLLSNTQNRPLRDIFTPIWSGPSKAAGRGLLLVASGTSCESGYR